MKESAETILFAEDDGMLREMLKETLAKVGYEVLVATDGEDALRVFYRNIDRIKLLILDVLMPKIKGTEVYYEIKRVNPNIKAILISGYSTDIIDMRLISEERFEFLTKPFILEEFLDKIREVLDT